MNTQMDNGDWLILDNCRIHTTKFSDKLTKYSPELNPPEKVFAKTKGILKRSTYRSRYDTLLDATIAAMDKITIE